MRISDAKNESEVWKVVNEITKPKPTSSNIKIKTPEGVITDELELATTMCSIT